MKIRKGDQVKMLGGKDNGKVAKVLQVLPKERRVSVEGLNLLIKHLRPSRQGEKGQRIEFPRFVDASSVAIVCPQCSKTTRVAMKMSKNSEGKNIKGRICKKCQQSLD